MVILEIPIGLQDEMRRAHICTGEDVWKLDVDGKLLLFSFLNFARSSPLVGSPAVSPNPSFAVEEYLVATCGLTRPQALKASAKLSHLKSPSNPDAVLAFLAGLGLSAADVAALVAKDPQFLCAKVERTLAPVVAGLTGLGLSRSDIAHLVSLSRDKFRCRSFVSNLQYFLHLLGSFENLLPALRRGSCFLSSDLETVVKPNVAFLRECGLGDSDIAKLCMAQLMLLGSNIECVRAMAARAQDIGVPCGSRMFRHALKAVAFLSNEKIAAKVEHLKKTFMWSDAVVGVVVSKHPSVLMRSNQMLQSKSEFLISEVGLEPTYIAHRPALLTYSLEVRLRPRHYVVKFLKESGLLDRGRDYYRAVMISEKAFVEKFICPHKEVAPHLAEDYAAACRGEVPSSFRFT
ncbi:transcription termination factor MTERF4, chloroplastic-like [Triticum aestivum]|uniref:transcription termination factor MTERF4, chloroplastic-like n=1 Tax=Triticum aestivum TaxID=4565 RepID=UPI001D00F641|nr:transcription termination factor MTERF4, chloroplastic-like [Triticum aestivum]